MNFIQKSAPPSFSSTGSTARGTIFDIRKFSIHDGPGIRTTVFFKGCPLACWWCHNPESQSIKRELYYRVNRCTRCEACIQSCPQHAISLNCNGVVTNLQSCTLCGACTEACVAEAREIAGNDMGVEDVMEKVRSDIPFYDESGGGVTFSGGEPLMQPDFLEALLKACRKEEIHTALDTSGLASWQTIERMLPYVNLYLYDLKLMDDEKHRKYTGVSNQTILENLKRLSGLGKSIFLRIPIIPGINDDRRNLEETGRLAASLPGVKRVDILPYHNSAAAKYERLEMPYRLKDLASPSPEEMKAIARSLEDQVLSVHIGG